jgi:hypothetical protein
MYVVCYDYPAALTRNVIGIIYMEMSMQPFTYLRAQDTVRHG